MSINKLQVHSALTQVIHPNFGQDLISLGIIQDIIVQDKFITFAIEIADENPIMAQKLTELCENAIRRYVVKDAIIDIQTDHKIETRANARAEHNTLQPAGSAEQKATEIEQGPNPMNMEETTSANFTAPSTVKKVPYEEMPELLKIFIDEHKEYVEELDKFEEALIRFKKQQWQLDEETARTFSHFFTFLDNHIMDHNRREETKLFPLLKKRFMQSGEHSQKNRYMETGDEEPRTAVEVMEDEHVQIIQLSTLAFNFLGLAQRLPDVNSQSIVSDLAFEQGRQIVEILRLHIKREDETLFPLACQLIEQDEFEEMLNSV